MDLNFFADPDLAPKPRDQIRIEAFNPIPYPDGRRVRVDLVITPFAPSDCPNLEVRAYAADGALVASTTIIEAVQRSVTITMHLRNFDNPEAELTFTADLYYSEQPVQHTVTQTIHLSDIQGSDNSNAS